MDVYNSPSAEFFTSKGDSFTTVGDWIGRVPALQLANPKPGEIVVDAGCGAGLVSRMIARQVRPRLIARCIGRLDLFGDFPHDYVYGLDLSERMLKAAEKMSCSGIQYLQRDITQTMATERQGAVDLVVCIAVAMHLSPVEIEGFLQEAHRILRPGGRLLLSYTHPYLYQPDSPTRTGQSRWMQLKPVGEEEHPDLNRKFTEFYTNKHGQTFEAEVWCHPKSFMENRISRTGFNLLCRQDTYVTPDVIAKSSHWHGSPTGHPAFFQLLAQKPR